MSLRCCTCRPREHRPTDENSRYLYHRICSCRICLRSSTLSLPNVENNKFQKWRRRGFRFELNSTGRCHSIQSAAAKNLQKICISSKKFVFPPKNLYLLQKICICSKIYICCKFNFCQLINAVDLRRTR